MAIDSNTAQSPTANRSGVQFGAGSTDPQAARATWREASDMRAKLSVPAEYILEGPGRGPDEVILNNGGILFPYTPSISMDNQATYSNQTPLHSNYPINFYQKSSVGPITLSAKFTAQNEFEGAMLLGTIHILRALTKMKFGSDTNAGSPPPVCRLNAYGDSMINNVPVAVASWKHELPDNVDYISVGRPGSPGLYGHSMVPTLSTISITFNVMYSRREMLAFNVGDWNAGNLAGGGYL
jgi:hypothetical protein